MEQERWSRYHKKGLSQKAVNCSCFPVMENLSLSHNLRNDIHDSPVLWNLLKIITTISKEHKEKYFTEDRFLRTVIDEENGKQFLSAGYDEQLSEILIILLEENLFNECIKEKDHWIKNMRENTFVYSDAKSYLLSIGSLFLRKCEKCSLYDRKYKCILCHVFYPMTGYIRVTGVPPSPKALVGLLSLMDKWEFRHEAHHHKDYICGRIIFIILAAFLVAFVLIMGSM